MEVEWRRLVLVKARLGEKRKQAYLSEGTWISKATIHLVLELVNLTASSKAGVLFSLLSSLFHSHLFCFTYWHNRSVCYSQKDRRYAEYLQQRRHQLIVQKTLILRSLQIRAFMDIV